MLLIHLQQISFSIFLLFFDTDILEMETISLRCWLVGFMKLDIRLNSELMFLVLYQQYLKYQRLGLEKWLRSRLSVFLNLGFAITRNPQDPIRLKPSVAPVWILKQIHITLMYTIDHITYHTILLITSCSNTKQHPIR